MLIQEKTLNHHKHFLLQIFCNYIFFVTYQSYKLLNHKTMKKLYLLLICICGFLFTSCLNNKNLPINDDTNDSMPFESFQKYGDAHNFLLSYANDNFVQTRANAINLDEGIDFLLQLQLEDAALLPLDNQKLNLLQDGLSHFKNWYLTQNMYSESFTRTRNGDNKIESEFDSLLQENTIDAFEHTGLITLVQAIEDNYNGILSTTDFLSIVESLISQWKKQNYTKDSNYSHTLAITLSISKSSLEWWMENDMTSTSTRAVPAFVGADVAGAVIGAASSAGYQLVSNGSVGDWGAVGWGAASGAVVGSTGVVGKIGKFLSSLF